MESLHVAGLIDDLNRALTAHGNKPVQVCLDGAWYDVAGVRYDVDDTGLVPPDDPTSAGVPFHAIVIDAMEVE